MSLNIFYFISTLYFKILILIYSFDFFILWLLIYSSLTQICYFIQNRLIVLNSIYFLYLTGRYFYPITRVKKWYCPRDVFVYGTPVIIRPWQLWHIKGLDCIVIVLVVRRPEWQTSILQTTNPRDVRMILDRITGYENVFGETNEKKYK